MLAKFNQTYHAISSSFIQHYLRATQKSFIFRLHLGVPRFCYNISFPEKLPPGVPPWLYFKMYVQYRRVRRECSCLFQSAELILPSRTWLVAWCSPLPPSPPILLRSLGWPRYRADYGPEGRAPGCWLLLPVSTLVLTGTLLGLQWTLGASG